MHKRISPHGDYDHMGEAINLVNIFKVEKVIFNCGVYNYLEKELIKVLEQIKMEVLYLKLKIKNYRLRLAIHRNKYDIIVLDWK